MPNPVDDPELYDSIVVSGLSSPGKVTLSGHDRKIGWDVKKAPGQKGATTTRTSEDPVEFTASFYLADQDDFAAWDEFATLLTSTVSGSEPKALDIYHPDLAANDILSIVLASFGGVVHDGKGGQTIAVKLLEYRPPKKAGGTPNGSKTSASEKLDPNAQANAELKRLVNQYQATPWG